MATLYSMKKIEIIIQGGQLDYIKDLLQRAKVTGYTLIPNLAGIWDTAGITKGNSCLTKSIRR